MKISILSVGKLKEPFWQTAQAEYCKRLGPYVKLSIIEVVAEKLGGSVSDEEVMRREGERIINQLPAEAVVIALERSGEQFSSEKFSEMIDDLAGDGTPLVFVVGGAVGLSIDVLNRADHRLSLAEMTLPHELARIFLLEQIYRATQIARRGKYHR
ncbi:23S rRNA (pseudouridine(1915)-N(3))-methyltransferase RlmH [Patescibacteria group bacterium]|nr:23S rRNA (pseudouridine(1915)-N(3))-methyltransferase RlmH [Patescibacteria group bacterium]MBU1916228.1 23S rRNA (pseudouridine(1915)-N(3))-methyltransferase RlmH [Patescibacteria group bacterium]